MLDGGSSNGRTRGFGPRHQGSNPCPPVINYGEISIYGWPGKQDGTSVASKDQVIDYLRRNATTRYVEGSSPFGEVVLYLDEGHLCWLALDPGGVEACTLPSEDQSHGCV